MTIEKRSRFNVTRRMRLAGYDYQTPGYYFTTVCQRDRRLLFSDTPANSCTPNSAGKMILLAIDELESRFTDVQIDASVVMPNHVHLLIGLSISENASERDSIIDAMHWWKTVTTTRYITGVKKNNWPRYKGSLWQEGYHDRIVRNEGELNLIRNYIRENPIRWREDEFFSTKDK